MTDRPFKQGSRNDALYRWLNGDGLTIAEGMRRLGSSSMTVVQTAHHVAQKSGRKLIVEGDFYKFAPPKR